MAFSIREHEIESLKFKILIRALNVTALSNTDQKNEAIKSLNDMVSKLHDLEYPELRKTREDFSKKATNLLDKFDISKIKLNNVLDD